MKRLLAIVIAVLGLTTGAYAAALEHYTPTGPGLIRGSQLNLMVDIINNMTGNGTAQAGTFTTLSASGNFAVATNKFTVAAASGNTVVAGTLGVTGASTFTGLLTANGHVATGATPPVLTSCGGGTPTIAGSDRAGLVTMGTSATGCVITFAAAYTAAPFCVVTWQATPLASQSYAVSTTAITLTQTSTSTNTVMYNCIARSGG